MLPRPQVIRLLGKFLGVSKFHGPSCVVFGAVGWVEVGASVEIAVYPAKKKPTKAKTYAALLTLCE
jgi:hypothetical protein